LFILDKANKQTKILLARKLFKVNTLFNLNIFKLILLLMVAGMAANAQEGRYQPYSIGVGYGSTIAKAGEQTLTSANAVDVSFNYHFTPFTSVSLEGQFGQLTGGNAQTDIYAKQFINNYKAFILHTDIQLGEFIDYSHNPFLNGLKNVYGGIGAGILSNNIGNNIVFNQATPESYIIQSTNVLIPLRVGYEFKIFNHYDEPQFRFDVNYSFNTAFGKGLDGYSNYTTSVKFYNYLSLGLKYSFGPVAVYRKLVYYSNF
jgi:hypothetical protein